MVYPKIGIKFESKKIKMKIATYNVNGISSRLPILLRWLDAAQPDVVCLQELKAPQEKFPKADLETAGYHAVWKGQKSWNGVAVLTKNQPAELVRDSLPGDDQDEASRYLEVRVADFTISSIYVPNGNPLPGAKFDYKLRWLERLEAHAELLISAGKKGILAGDFNIIPTDFDVYKPEKYRKDALMQPQVQDYFQKLQQQGWTDALRFLFPKESMYTFWDYFRNAYPRNAGMRIDHFLLSPEVLPILQTASVATRVRGWEKSSDHAPVLLELKY